MRRCVCNCQWSAHRRDLGTTPSLWLRKFLVCRNPSFFKPLGAVGSAAAIIQEPWTRRPGRGSWGYGGGARITTSSKYFFAIGREPLESLWRWRLGRSRRRGLEPEPFWRRWLVELDASKSGKYNTVLILCVIAQWWGPLRRVRRSRVLGGRKLEHTPNDVYHIC